MIALAAASGAISSGAHGGLRALLVRLAPAESRMPALSLEPTASTIVWTAAPALLGLLAVVEARLAVLVMAALAAAGAVIAHRLPDPRRPRSRACGGRAGPRWPTTARSCSSSARSASPCPRC